MEQTTETQARTNEDWLGDLTASDTRRDAALEDLRAKLQRGLYAFLRGVPGDGARRHPEDVRQMSEDFAQESMLKVLDGLATFRGESRFLTWAMKIAVRTALSSLRRAANRDLSLEDLEARGAALQLPPEASVRPAPLPDPQREAERKELLAVLEQGVQTELSEKQRVAFLATGIDGVPVEVVARLMGSNPNALYKLIHDARRKLRSFLIGRGFTFDGVAQLFESA